MRPDVKVIYRARNGARYMNDEQARIAGEAKDRLHKKIRRAPTTEEYAALVSARSDPAYPVWKSIRDAHVQRAGLFAAVYMLDNLIEVEIREDGSEGKSHRAALAIELEQSEKSTRWCTPKEVQQSPELIAGMLLQFQTKFRGSARNVADVAGVARTKRAVEEVLREF